jgi:nucleoside-diphosphate-sugar epimerase
MTLMPTSHPQQILILGCAGFIGSHLCEHILAHTDWHIIGFDLHQENIKHLLNEPRLSFRQGNIFEDQAWIEQAVASADVVLPLVAIANPALYVKDPLRVFELDFEANLNIIRLCVKYQKRVIIPSTSEVYGMCPDAAFDEETSNLVVGPVNKSRWIYSCSKQLLDRVVTAYGEREGLRYSIFRPFNFMGPRLDNLKAEGEGASRAFTQFVGNVMRGKPISLVDGGAQERCYVYIDDAIEALVAIIANKDGVADKQIYNIGNPDNVISMRDLALMIIEEMRQVPSLADVASTAQLIDVSGKDYFGAGYQDVASRVPSIAKAHSQLQWQPHVTIRQGIQKTLAFYFNEISA